MPKFVPLPTLGTKKPRVWVSGLLLHMLWTPRHQLHPLPKPKSTPLSSASKSASPPLSHKTRAMTLATFAVKKGIGPMNVQTRLTSKQSLTPTLSNLMEALWDLHNILDAEFHTATVDTTKKDKEDSRQTNKDGNTFLQLAQSPPSL